VACLKTRNKIWSPSLDYGQDVQAWWQDFVQHGQKFVRVNELNHTNFDILSFAGNSGWGCICIRNFWMWREASAVGHGHTSAFQGAFKRSLKISM
jgi:hypothetical protein